MAINWFDLPAGYDALYGSIGNNRMPLITKDMIATLPGSVETDAMGGQRDLPSRYAFTPEVLAELNASGINWGGQRNNIEWQLGMTPEEAALLSQSFKGDFSKTGISPSVKIKTDDKEGTTFDYVWNDQAQAYVPQLRNVEGWDTNAMNKKMLQHALMAAAVMGGGALAMGAAGAGAGGAAAGSAGAGGAGALGAGSPWLGTLGAPSAGLLGGEAMFLGAAPEVLTAAGIDAGLTSAAMGGAAGMVPGAFAPSMGAALTGGLGAGGAALTNAALAGASGIGTGLLNAGGLANATWPQTTTPSAPPGTESATKKVVEEGAKKATSPLLQKAADYLGIDAGLLGDALKLGGPLLGGALTAWEASQQNGQENPQDVWTRDWARNRLSNPKTMPTAVTGPYREQMTGLLGQAPSDTIQQLKAKRFY